MSNSPSNNSDQSTHQRRQENLENAREDVMQLRRESQRLRSQGQLNQTQARGQYRSAVSNFVFETLQVLDSAPNDTDIDYEHGYHLGTVVIQPPDELVTYAQNNLHALPPDETVPRRIEQEITGLRQIQQRSEYPPFRKEFSVTMRRGGQLQKTTRYQDSEFSFQVLDNAVRACVQALADVGIGLSLSEQRTKIDEDLFKEVDEWLNENNLI